MRITKEIISAIEEAASRCGGMAGIFRKSGIKESTLSRVVNQKQDRVDDDTWDLLYEVIQKHLPHDSTGMPLPEYRPASWWRDHPQMASPPTTPNEHACLLEGMPHEVLQMVDNWKVMSEDEKATLISVIRMALKKYSPRAVPLSQPCSESTRKLA